MIVHSNNTPEVKYTKIMTADDVLGVWHMFLTLLVVHIQKILFQEELNNCFSFEVIDIVDG